MSIKEKQLKVAVIGRSGQAGRFIELLKKSHDVSLSAVFYPKKTEETELPITRNFESLLIADAIIIASPTDTHSGYLKRLKDFKGYILLEKPGFSSKSQGLYLKSQPVQRKCRIRINYNLRHSEIFRELSKLVEGSRLGKLIFFNVHTSHGLAFQKKYRDSWRADLKRSFGVMELVGVHYINMVIKLFGPLATCQTQYQWYAGIKNGPPDTVFTRMRTKKGLIVNLFHSYAGPLRNNLLLFGTDGFWEYDGQKARFHFPRETKGPDGRFIEPLFEEKEIKHGLMWQQSLQDSLDDFLFVVKKRGKFNLLELDQAVDSMEPILKALAKLKR